MTKCVVNDFKFSYRVSKFDFDCNFLNPFKYMHIYIPRFYGNHSCPSIGPSKRLRTFKFEYFLHYSEENYFEHNFLNFMRIVE